MKRFLILSLVFICFLCIPIHGDSKTLKYEICTSSKQESLIVIKREILSKLDELCLGLQSESYVDIVEENIEYFEKKDVKAFMKGEILYLIYGDGKGKKLHGIYEKSGVCFEKVEPESIFVKWWKNVVE